MRIIALSGLPRSGKDALADTLVAEKGFRRLQFSAPLKEASAVLLRRPLHQMYGEEGYDREAAMPEWGFSVRWFLQTFGTECMRNVIRPDFWLKHMEIQLQDQKDTIITDLRFENEAALVRANGGIVIGITRPGIKPSAHVSDAGVVCDTTYDNSGTLEDLARFARSLGGY